MTALQLLASLVLLLGNAFFVGAEFAVVSVRRSQVQPLAEAGDRRARTVLHALESLSAMLAAAQLGVTVCSLLLGALAEPTLAHLLEGPFAAAGLPAVLTHPAAYALALLLVVSLHMVIGEMVPKNVALAGPERAALWLGPPLAAVARALRPVIAFLNALAGSVLRLVRVPPRAEVEAAFDSEQFARLVEDSRQAGLLGPGEQERLSDALELGRRPVRDVLVPLADLVTVTASATPEEVERIAVATGFSRFPVADGAGSLLGYLHVKDILDLEDRACPVPAAARRRIGAVRDRTPLDDALTVMRRTAAHLAAVVDAHGRTLGVVTMEDVLQELVGEADDPARPSVRPPVRGRSPVGG